jgi:hypothetical protein
MLNSISTFGKAGVEKICNPSKITVMYKTTTLFIITAVLLACGIRFPARSVAITGFGLMPDTRENTVFRINK